MLRNSQTAKLSHNLRTLGSAVIQFAADHGNRFPASSGGSFYPSWQMGVAPYVGENLLYNKFLDNDPAAVKRSIFRDPLDKTVGTYGGKTRHIRNIAINGMASFGSYDIEPAAWGASYRLISTIEQPSKLLLLTTGQHSEVNEEFAGGGMRVRSTFYISNPENFTRIPGWYYCLFADGHLEILDLETISREAEDDNRRNTSCLFDIKANNGAGK